jgi:hypothetical protein
MVLWDVSCLDGIVQIVSGIMGLGQTDLRRSVLYNGFIVYINKNPINICITYRDSNMLDTWDIHL